MRKPVHKLIHRLLNEERSADPIEYRLLAAFVATIAVVILLGDPLGLVRAVRQAYTRVVTALSQA
ncbi:MAG: hypothetical protein DMD82_02685 [Candidatus Rokuibacteriota bacterium]|nr:MAG: hypothetical protein DMD82_02685 [Candidatus Rokubacteria bacterium]